MLPTERVPTWRHAVTFDRPYSRDDERLASELLDEWGRARGLRSIHDDGASSQVLQLIGGWLPVYVERDNYGAWAGYAMAFVSADSATWTHTLDNFLAPTRETRLCGKGRPGLSALRWYEEHYDATAAKQPNKQPNEVTT